MVFLKARNNSKRPQSESQESSIPPTPIKIHGPSKIVVQNHQIWLPLPHYSAIPCSTEYVLSFLIIICWLSLLRVLTPSSPSAKPCITVAV